MSMESTRACRPMRLLRRRSKRKSSCCASSRCRARDPKQLEERWGSEARHTATIVTVIREDDVMQMEATLHMANSNAARRPEFAEILGRVRKLRPEIGSRALATEKAKRVPAETMEALRDADVFRTMQPRRFGGYEYGPAELAQIGFELGRACGSTGWCGSLAVCFGWMTGFFPLGAQQGGWDDPGKDWERG